MAQHKIGSKQCDTDTITNILYLYLVQNQSAATILFNELGMSKAEIGNPKRAWTKLKNEYQWFGFQKAYKFSGHTPYETIGYSELRQYVIQHWNVRATEADLLRAFPQIKSALEEAKDKDMEMDSSWESSGKGTPGELDPDYHFRTQREEAEEVIPYRAPKKTVRRARRSDYSDDTPIAEGKSPGCLPIVLAVSAIVLAIVFVFNLFDGTAVGKVGKKRASFGRTYDVEVYEYNGLKLIGNKSLGKPVGVNMSYRNGIPQNTPYDLAEYKKEIRNGEGAYCDGLTLRIGNRKKNVFTKSWCLEVSGSVVTMAYYKNDKPTGIGLRRENDVTQIVNYNKQGAVIATYRDGQWFKPNDKVLKLNADGEYKGMKLIDDTHARVKGIDFCLNARNASYHSETFHFDGVKNQFDAQYYSEKELIHIEYLATQYLKMIVEAGGGHRGYEIKPQ